MYFDIKPIIAVNFYNKFVNNPHVLNLIHALTLLQYLEFSVSGSINRVFRPVQINIHAASDPFL